MQDRPVLNMDVNFEDFMRTKAPQVIQNIKGTEMPQWGMMTVHHMIEHLVFPLNFATGVIHSPIFTPEEKLPRNKEFLHSHYGLMQGFKMPLLPKDENPPLMTKSLDEAKTLLSGTIDKFLHSVDDPAFTTANHPIFGKLNRDEWLIFQYKHFMHHFMQFGLA